MGRSMALKVPRFGQVLLCRLVRPHCRCQKEEANTGGHESPSQGDGMRYTVPARLGLSREPVQSLRLLRWNTTRSRRAGLPQKGLSRRGATENDMSRLQPHLERFSRTWIHRRQRKNFVSYFLIFMDKLYSKIFDCITILKTKFYFNRNFDLFLLSSYLFFYIIDQCNMCSTLNLFVLQSCAFYILYPKK